MGGDEYRLDGLAVPGTIDQLHDLLERVGAEHPDVPAGDLSMFETAVVEIAGNIVEHGRPPGKVRYTFSLHVRPDRLVGVLSDSGARVDRDVVDRARSHTPDPDDEQGRGLPLANAALDVLVHDHDGCGNRWLMTRLRRDAEGGPEG